MLLNGFCHVVTGVLVQLGKLRGGEGRGRKGGRGGGRKGEMKRCRKGGTSTRGVV